MADHFNGATELECWGNGAKVELLLGLAAAPQRPRAPTPDRTVRSTTKTVAHTSFSCSKLRVTAVNG
eukprot:3465104-Rhodomonas_salina.1